MRIAHTFLVAAMLVISGAAQAQTVLPANVTVDDVVRLLNERSPRTVADRATIAVAAADRITAQALPNPDISYGGVHLVGGLSTGAVHQHQFVYNQPLLIFRQRAARVAAADLDTET